ncbi:hypothetical protein Tco_0291816 [Tanacetum coccineum]|uniref:Reverse transcriptase/retrotransposon-derived protein RNase H-like domain-containing protein n=1 Tax=Tanacetum coccineum TaxID=301880 RepID=A0ABQ5BCL2_9ASTR
MIRLRAKAPSNSHSLPLPLPIILSRTRSDAPPSGTPHILPIPLPNSSLSLLLPSTNHGADRPKVCLQPTKVLCFAFGPRYEVEESSSVLATRPTRGFKAAYGFIDTLYREIRRDSEREVGYGITDTWGTYEIYVRLGEAQDERSLMSGRLNLLQRDRRAHAHTALLMKREARLSCGSTTVRDYSLVSSRSHSAGISCGDTKTDEYTADISDSTAGTLQLKAMIDQGVTDALAARDADRNTNGDDSHNSGTGVRRTERVARECTYPDFMKCQPLNFKGTEGVVKLIQWSGIMDKYVSFQATNQSENQIKFFRLYPSLQVKSLLAMNVEPRDNLDRDCSKLEKQPMWVTKVGNGKAPAKKLCTAFSSQIDITPTTLDHYYDVELADVRIIRLNAIIRGERHLMIGPLQQGKNCRPTGKENYSTRLHKASIHSHLGELPVLFVKKKDDPFQCSSPAPSTEERLSEAAFRTRYGHYEFQIRQAMTKLTQKKVKFVWGDKQKTVFQLLKQKLCSALILALPEGSEDFIAYCDALIKGFVKSKEWL